MKTILITGANGFVGKNLSKHFAENDWHIVALDSEKSISLPLSKNIKYINVDITDNYSIDKIFSQSDHIDVVVHTAAISDHFPNIPWETYYKVNVEGSKNIATAAMKWKVKYFVYLSSSSVYGKNYSGVTEDNNLCDYDFYSKSKSLVEREVLSYNHNAIILRPSPFYGYYDPKNTIYKLFYQMRKTHISPKITRTLKSLCYIENLMDFIDILIESNKSFGEIYNIADSEPYNLSYITDVISLYLDTFIIPLKIPKILLSTGYNLLKGKFPA